MIRGNINSFRRNWEGVYFSSDVMSAQGLKITESKLSVFEDEDNQKDSDVGPFMRNLFEKQLYTDVIFLSNGNKSSISAHRAVLAAKCEFFRKLLFGEQKNDAFGMEMQVQISNVPFSIFTNIVKYFYTDDIEFTDDHTVLEIYAAAQSFEIQELIDQCDIYIESMGLTEDNVCSILQICNTKHIERLKSRCLSYIEKNTLPVTNSTDFEKCSFSTVREICDLRCMNLRSEMELLEAVLRWIKVQPKHTRKELARSLLKCIRFLSLTPKEFTDIIQRQANLMTSEEGLKILMYLNNPTPESLKTLPTWCNKCQRSYQVEHEEIQKDVSQQCSKEGRIIVLLKPFNGCLNITDLTSVLEMRCIKGVQQIKSIKFSFEDIKNDGSLLADLVLKIRISPNGLTFSKNHLVKSEESTFIFLKPITVFRGQTVIIEIKARNCQSCRFLQFRRWYNDPKLDFQCFFLSIPKLAKLNFISEIEYVRLEQ